MAGSAAVTVPALWLVVIGPHHRLLMYNSEVRITVCTGLHAPRHLVHHALHVTRLVVRLTKQLQHDIARAVLVTSVDVLLIWCDVL